MFITDIRYLREEAIGAVYSGFLICNKKKFSVEVYKKGSSSLKFYIVDDDRLLPASFNTEKNGRYSVQTTDGYQAWRQEWDCRD